MFAEIASGHRDAADLLLLVAAIMFAVAAVLHLSTATFGQLEGFLTKGGLALVAFALFIT